MWRHLTGVDAPSPKRQRISEDEKREKGNYICIHDFMLFQNTWEFTKYTVNNCACDDLLRSKLFRECGQPYWWRIHLG